MNVCVHVSDRGTRGSHWAQVLTAVFPLTTVDREGNLFARYAALDSIDLRELDCMLGREIEGRIKEKTLEFVMSEEMAINPKPEKTFARWAEENVPTKVGRTLARKFYDSLKISSCISAEVDKAVKWARDVDGRKDTCDTYFTIARSEALAWLVDFDAEDPDNHLVKLLYEWEDKRLNRLGRLADSLAAPTSTSPPIPDSSLAAMIEERCACAKVPLKFSRLLCDGNKMLVHICENWYAELLQDERLSCTALRYVPPEANVVEIRLLPFLGNTAELYAFKNSAMSCPDAVYSALSEPMLKFLTVVPDKSTSLSCLSAHSDTLNIHAALVKAFDRAYRHASEDVCGRIHKIISRESPDRHLSPVVQGVLDLVRFHPHACNTDSHCSYLKVRGGKHEGPGTLNLRPL